MGGRLPSAAVTATRRTPGEDSLSPCRHCPARLSKTEVSQRAQTLGPSSAHRQLRPGPVPSSVSGVSWALPEGGVETVSSLQNSDLSLLRTRHVMSFMLKREGCIVSLQCGSQSLLRKSRTKRYFCV